LAIRARLPAFISLRGEFSGNEGVEAAWRNQFCGCSFAPNSRMDDCPNSARGACGVAQDAAERAQRAKPASRGRSSRLRASRQNAAYPSVSISGASRSGMRRPERPSRSGPSSVSTFVDVDVPAGVRPPCYLHGRPRARDKLLVSCRRTAATERAAIDIIAAEIKRKVHRLCLTCRRLFDVQVPRPRYSRPWGAQRSPGCRIERPAQHVA
jgi:hypothetical protein